MKKFKNVFMVLVLALVLTAGAKVVSIWANETREITVNVEKSYKDAKTKVFVGSLSGQEIVA